MHNLISLSYSLTPPLSFSSNLPPLLSTEQHIFFFFRFFLSLSFSFSKEQIQENDER